MTSVGSDPPPLAGHARGQAFEGAVVEASDFACQSFASFRGSFDTVASGAPLEGFSAGRL